jgi:predicted porin
MKKLVVAVFVCLLASTAVARADTASDLQAQMAAMQKQMDAMQAQLDKLQAQKAAAAVAPAVPPGSTPVMVAPGNNTTFLIHGEPIQLYGVLDVSLDDTTKGLQSFYKSSGDGPVGNVGWQPAISSQSWVGLRSARTLANKFSAVYQLETQIDVSATSGTVNTNSNNDNTVKGALTSRNSFIGVGNQFSGSFLIGKTDAPYKTSTARMNPFSNMLGDYGVIMGNTGGDNRVEFGTRLDHALWWSSPNWRGFTMSLLTSPGQNRGVDDDLIAQGEAGCSGGNAPGSGALPPSCNDGAFGSAYSGSASYEYRHFYITTAYELHKKVNRTSDLPDLDPRDVADEDAAKIGSQWTFGPQTSIEGIYESMHRYVPAFLMDQNERTRNGFWLAGTQAVGHHGDNFSLGWARANPTPGDPGQHNTPTLYPNAANPTLFGTPNPDNMANMYTAMFRHIIDQHLSFYFDYAQTVNHAYAHYDLGAGGRGLTTDCHDGTVLAAFDPTANNGAGGESFTGPHCYAGGDLRGFSTGIRLQF